jgi:hypothetical protein
MYLAIMYKIAFVMSYKLHKDIKDIIKEKFKKPNLEEVAKKVKELE